MLTSSSPCSYLDFQGCPESGPYPALLSFSQYSHLLYCRSKTMLCLFPVLTFSTVYPICLWYIILLIILARNLSTMFYFPSLYSGTKFCCFTTLISMWWGPIFLFPLWLSKLSCWVLAVLLTLSHADSWSSQSTAGSLNPPLKWPKWLFIHCLQDLVQTSVWHLGLCMICPAFAVYLSRCLSLLGRPYQIGKKL